MGNVKDRTGTKYGYLTAIRYTGKTNRNRHALWECKCDCGNVIIADSANLESGSIKSCGCLIKSKNNITHGQTNTRLYRIWRDIKTRTTYKSKSICHIYRDKNIEMCDEWKKFDAFYKWACENGYEDNLTIDRIDNDKGYYPDNCVGLQQKNNKEIKQQPYG